MPRVPIDEENEFPNWIGKVMGFKAALLNTEDGKGVEFWSWFDPLARIENGKLVTDNKWLLRYHGIDKGQFGSKKLLVLSLLSWKPMVA